MITFEKNEAQDLSLGYYIQFQKSNERCYRVNIRSLGLFRAEVTIMLPDTKKGTWCKGVEQVIENIQSGSRLPLRLNWENAQQFFTLEELAALDYRLGDVPFYLYGVPNSRKSYLETLYRAKHAERERRRRAAK